MRVLTPILLSLSLLLASTVPAMAAAGAPDCCGPNAVNMYPGEYTAPDGARLAPNPQSPEYPFFDMRGDVTISVGDCSITWPFLPDQQLVLDSNKNIVIACVGDKQQEEMEACTNVYNGLLVQTYELHTQYWSNVRIAKADYDTCPLADDQYAFLAISR